MKTKNKGWRRLLIVLSIAWLSAILIGLIGEYRSADPWDSIPNADGSPPKTIFFMNWQHHPSGIATLTLDYTTTLMATFLPIAFFWFLYCAVFWIIAGFKREGKRE
jgi:hypothetical protein